MRGVVGRTAAARRRDEARARLALAVGGGGWCEGCAAPLPADTPLHAHAPVRPAGSVCFGAAQRSKYL